MVNITFNDNIFKHNLYKLVLWALEQGDNLPDEYMSFCFDVMFKQNIFMQYQPNETYYLRDRFYDALQTLGVDSVDFIMISTYNLDDNDVHIYTNSNIITKEDIEKYLTENPTKLYQYCENKFVDNNTIWLNYIDRYPNKIETFDDISIGDMNIVKRYAKQGFDE